MYELKKKQLEQAYAKQQKEISNLEDFVARNKARAATANMAKSRQKKLDQMDVIELGREKPKPIFAFTPARTTGKGRHRSKLISSSVTRNRSRAHLTCSLRRGQKIAVKGVNGLGKSTLLENAAGHNTACIRDG